MQDEFVHIYGGSIFDTIFELETPDGTYLWNTTKIANDAQAGRFGPPDRYDMYDRNGDCVIPEPNYGGLDREKIDRIKLLPDVLASPVLAIEGPEAGYIFCVCDGNHRLTARWELRLPDFLVYVVPIEIEKEYRITVRQEKFVS